jgi:hypothetical protein
MTTHNRNTIVVGIVVIAILILGFFAWKEREGTNASVPTSTATTTTATSTGTISISSNGQVTAPAGYTVTPIYSNSSGSVAPDYKAPLTFSGNQNSPAEISTLQSEYAQVETALKADPTDFSSWIQLGVIRKEAGDYQGAAADWQYVSEIYPANVVSNANLADLYTNFLPDYPKAAAAYEAQIKNDPTDIYIYVDLYQLYTTQYPQSAAVITAMLKQGLAANPGNAQLESLLAKYQ